MATVYTVASAPIKASRMSAAPPARIAVVHDWLLDYAGSERVLAEILRIFPQAHLFALVDHMGPGDRASLGGRTASTTFLQRMPFVAKRLEYYLPLMPLAIEQIDLTGYDLVVSSSHAVAKGVIVPPDALHVSYVHSPMRYAWDMQFAYLQGARMERGLRGALLRGLLHRLRIWDHRSAAGVDHFVANSRFVARRILKSYRREAEVIYPPVDVAFFHPSEGGTREDYYVAVGRLMHYKRTDLLLETFSRMPQRRLLIVGTGPLLARLRSEAPSNVELVGALSAEALRERLQHARAFIFPVVEDFGIAPVEALACGTPVIALRRGGAAETVLGLEAEAPTGVFFDEQSPEALEAAIQAFEANASRITAQACRRRAEEFSPARFREAFEALVEARYSAWRTALTAG